MSIFWQPCLKDINLTFESYFLSLSIKVDVCLILFLAFNSLGFKKHIILFFQHTICPSVLHLQI